MNIDLAFDTLVDLPFEKVLEGIKKIKDKNKRLREKGDKMMKRFDECIDLLGSHYKLNKELREIVERKTKKISMLREENSSLSIIIDDLSIVNNDLEKENKILWSEKKTECSESATECSESVTECGCCCGDLEECDCSCNCDCHEDIKREMLYKDLAEKEEKIKVFLTQIERLKNENKKLKKKQVFIFRAPTSP